MRNNGLILICPNPLRTGSPDKSAVQDPRPDFNFIYHRGAYYDVLFFAPGDPPDRDQDAGPPDFDDHSDSGDDQDARTDQDAGTDGDFDDRPLAGNPGPLGRSMRSRRRKPPGRISRPGDLRSWNGILGNLV